MKRIYRHLYDPKQYPEFDRRAAKAVTREALGNEIQFSSLRGFPSEGENRMAVGDAANPEARRRLLYIRETIDMYVRHFRIGRVLWPVYPTLLASNFPELVDICRDEGLYLYDFWGFVPGSRPGTDIWGEYKIPDEVDAYLNEQLGDKFLGYDNGEQDGRYVGSRSYTAPLIDDRRAQYRSFQRYFEKLNDSMRNHTVTLASLTFLHYFAREGNTIFLGAETAQALPSNPMWFSFIRGAGKQYGLLYYGNASVYNRFGWKSYDVEQHDDGNPYHGGGHLAGTSLSLMRRLLYNQYMYNCDLLGYESGWFHAEKSRPEDVTDESHYVLDGMTYSLTPIGEVTRAANDFVRAHGSPGVMYAPLALITDFHSGWMPPRQLYTQDIYKVWGALPYRAGDYQLENLFQMLFPHYDRASYFHDESGFETATPYGEIADVLLSDVRGAVLNRYAAAIVANDTELTLELYLKLKNFVSRGGKLLVFEGFVGANSVLAARCADYNEFFGVGTETGGASRIVSFGEGSVTVVQSADGLAETGENGYSNDNERDIPHPYRFDDGALASLDAFMRPLTLLYVTNPALQHCCAMKSDGEYTLFVANNTLSEETFDIAFSEGSIVSVEPLPIPDDVGGLPEYLPNGLSDRKSPTMTGGAYKIAAGDCLLFCVKTSGAQLCELPETAPDGPDDGLYLSVGYDCACAKDYLLDHPTLQHTFGGIMLPAEYFERLSDGAAERDAHYFRLQRVRVGVDFTHLIDHYPDISMAGNFPERAEELRTRAERTIRLASAYGCDFAVVCASRMPENHWSDDEYRAGLRSSFAEVSEICGRFGVKAFAQNNPLPLSTEEQYAIAREAGAGIARNAAFAEVDGSEPPKDEGLLLVSAAKRDIFGQTYKTQLPCAECPDAASRESCREEYRAARASGIPAVLTGAFKTWDDVTSEIEFLK